VDAVIKYFACGFVLCTTMAFTIEFLEYMTFQLAVIGAAYLLDVTEEDNSGYGGGGMHTMSDNTYDGQHGRLLGNQSSFSAGEDIVQGFFDRQPAAKICYILISSYVMAGLVEEVCKYFGKRGQLLALLVMGAAMMLKSV